MSNLLPISLPPGFTELTKAQKIDYIQALWDLTIDDSIDEEIAIPDWHLEILNDRLNSLAPVETMKTWDEVKTKLLQLCH